MELGKAFLLQFTVVSDELGGELHLVVAVLVKFSGASDLVVAAAGLAFDGHSKPWGKRFP